MKHSSCLVILVCILMFAALAETAAGQEQTVQKPPPDLAEVHYGPHPRHVLDLWKAKSPQPSPLVVFVHGGGFRSGSKAVLPATLLKGLLDHGISVATINYRLSPEVSFPAHYLDAGRAVQFARFKAREWNVDPRRIGGAGNSAGAATVLWLGFHDDLADPANSDPVLRESSRLACVAARGGQSSMDPRVIRQWVGEGAATHPVLPPFWGLKPEELETPKAYKIYEACSPITHLTADDPPVYAYHGESADMPKPDERRDRGIHHINFGLKLKEKMDQLGIECTVRRSDEVKDHDEEATVFFVRHLKPQLPPR